MIKVFKKRLAAKNTADTVSSILQRGGVRGVIKPIAIGAVMSGMFLASANAKDDMYIGMQYSHTVFGLSLKKEVTPKFLIQGTLGLTNSDDISVYGVRGIYKITETRDYYTYGFGSLSLWKYKALEVSGAFSSEWKDESSVGFGLGVGFEYNLKKFTDMPLYWSVELGYDKVSVDSIKGSAHGINLDVSTDIGGVFVGSGFHYRF